jgi:hypothetical protein
MAALVALWLAAAGGADVADVAVLACLIAGVNIPVCPTVGGPGLAATAGVDMFLVVGNSNGGADER